GDSITTDHISPAGSIKADSPAGKYLTAAGIAPKDFNSYGARRGNHEVMVRGTFGNIRLKNQLVSVVGGFSLYDGQLTPLFDAAMKYKQTNTPLLVIAGREYGTGSSRDWAAKGVRLLGVSAVLAISFERIHRSNLVGMGVLPLEFVDPADRDRLNLHGDESFALSGFDTLGPDHTAMTLTIAYPQQRPEQGPASGTKKDLAKQPHKLSIKLRARIDNNTEMQYFKAGGVLPFMLNQIAV
ncbi:MAG: aconitate hydratase, partial [Alphaproteobacteria bacterium]|nr:aconitate hydratase [Alphaproteobacteria bacterium]